MDEKSYWLAFRLIPGIGRVRLSRLKEHFGSLKRAWEAGPGELSRAGLDAAVVKAIVEGRPRTSPEGELEKLARNRVRALTLEEAEYPSRLKEIADPPPVLYLRGELLPEDEWAVAVVGTRKPTVYGRQVAESLVAELARNRITIVSGLARGIDGIAHNTALEAGGRTIAVLACGLDLVYPSEHLPLAQRIAERGALLSEHPLGVRPRAEYFPRRNRIMTGVSLGVLVVEGGEESGALISAYHALEQNREVFAVPGSIFSPASRGTHRLIQEGAKLVREPRDIFEELNLTMSARQLEMVELKAEGETEASLLKHLSLEPIHMDEICRRLKLPTAQVSSTLAMLEIKGLVRRVGGMNYTLAREAAASYGAK